MSNPKSKAMKNFFERMKENPEKWKQLTAPRSHTIHPSHTIGLNRPLRNTVLPPITVSRASNKPVVLPAFSGIHKNVKPDTEISPEAAQKLADFQESLK